MMASIIFFFYFQSFGNISNKFKWNTNTYTYSIRLFTGLLMYHACYTAEARRYELLTMDLERVETAAAV